MITSGETMEELRTMEAIQQMSRNQLELRDFFAAMAMTGIVASKSLIVSDKTLLSISAYEIADEMLKARKGE